MLALKASQEKSRKFSARTMPEKLLKK